MKKNCVIRHTALIFYVGGVTAAEVALIRVLGQVLHRENTFYRVSFGALIRVLGQVGPLLARF